MKNLTIITFLALFNNLISWSQGTDYDFERFKLDDAKHILVGMDLSPDQKYVAIGGIQSFPLYIYDWSEQKVVNTFDVGEWYAGSNVIYSSTGKYLLQRQLFYIDFAPNSDREVTFQVVNAETGKTVKKFDSYHAMSFTPDEKYIISLTAGEVAFWNLETGNKEKTFSVKNASNGVTISPDGKFIAVSRHPSEIELEDNPRYLKDKKALKTVLKYKQLISIYDAETFTEIKTIDEIYDIIYRLEFTKDGSTLLCLQIPHVKVQPNTAARQTYINTIDAINWEPQRKGFTSSATYEPDFKLSDDGKLFGLVSSNVKFLELHIYDFETGKMVHRFQQSYRLFEKNDGELVSVDSRTSFVFLPDNKSVLMTMGNRLILWNMESNKF